MAIEKPTLDVSPTFQVDTRKRGTAFVNPRGEPTIPAIANPTLPGQMRIEPALDLKSAVLYVAVEVSSGVLLWKRVQPVSAFIDSRTGKPWDPGASYKYSYAR